MAKKRYTTEYVSIKPLLKYATTYYILYGERGDGKTYTGKVDVILEDILDGFKFVYMRREHRHIVRKNMIKVFDDVQPIFEEKLGSKIYYEVQKGFYIMTDEGEKVVGYVTTVEDAFVAKSVPIVNIRSIVFDEFIDYNYMQNEVSMFLHAISNICRPPNDNVRICMFGNTINRDSPYFKLFGIDASKLNQGEIYFLKHKLGVTATVMRTPTKVDDLRSKTKINKYIGFDDNESVNMIMFGEWEYQHCKTKSVDGIGWNCMRHLIPIYITYLNIVYEISIHTDSKLPIAFVRTVNVQLGKVKNRIKYNLALDDSVKLISKDGFVPTVSKINSLVDNKTKNMWELFINCFNCGRVIFDDISTGSDIMNILRKV